MASKHRSSDVNNLDMPKRKLKGKSSGRLPGRGEVERRGQILLRREWTPHHQSHSLGGKTRGVTSFSESWVVKVTNIISDYSLEVKSTSSRDELPGSKSGFLVHGQDRVLVCETSNGKIRLMWLQWRWSNNAPRPYSTEPETHRTPPKCRWFLLSLLIKGLINHCNHLGHTSSLKILRKVLGNSFLTEDDPLLPG